MSYIHKYVHESEDGSERRLELHYTFIPGHAGKLSGPPEDCYQAEDPEVEIQTIVDPVTGNEILDEELGIDWDDLVDAILDKHQEDYGCEDDYDDPDTDYDNY